MAKQGERVTNHMVEPQFEGDILLNPHQRETLIMLCQGFDKKGISAQLGIPEDEVPRAHSIGSVYKNVYKGNYSPSHRNTQYILMQLIQNGQLRLSEILSERDKLPEDSFFQWEAREALSDEEAETLSSYYDTLLVPQTGHTLIQKPQNLKKLADKMHARSLEQMMVMVMALNISGISLTASPQDRDREQIMKAVAKYEETGIKQKKTATAKAEEDGLPVSLENPLILLDETDPIPDIVLFPTEEQQVIDAYRILGTGGNLYILRRVIGSKNGIKNASVTLLGASYRREAVIQLLEEVNNEPFSQEKTYEEDELSVVSRWSKMIVDNLQDESVTSFPLDSKTDVLVINGSQVLDNNAKMIVFTLADEHKESILKNPIFTSAFEERFYTAFYNKAKAAKKTNPVSVREQPSQEISNGNAYTHDGRIIVWIE